MSGWNATRIPITVVPMPGEALDSWIEAYARRLHTCSRGFLNHLGLPGCQPRHMVMLLTDTERDTLSAATGVAPATLNGMTLECFDGIAVTLNQRRRIAEHPPTWRRHSGSRYCPDCLRDDDGCWQLTWRLPWTFACPRHHKLLADTCPACQRRTHPDRPGHRGEPTMPGTCTAPAAHRNRGAHTPACAHPLTNVTTTAIPPDGLVTRAGQHLHHLIDTGTAGDPTARGQTLRTLDDLFLLARKALHALQSGEREAPDTVCRVVAECGGTIPPPFAPLGPLRTHTIAVATTLAVTAHTCDKAGNTLLAWIVGHDRRRLARPEPNILLRRWQQCGPELIGRVLGLFDDTLQAHRRLAYASPTPRPRLPQASQTQLQRRAAALPARLWPGWSMLLIPADNNAYNALDSTRAALSALTLIPGGRLTYQQAVDLLDADGNPRQVRTVLESIPTAQLGTTITLLTQLADHLDDIGSPIDYTRRRAQFATSATTIDRRAYATFAAEHGWRRPSTLQLRILDRHLATILTGTAANTRVGPTRWGAADAFNLLLSTLPTAVRRFVHDQAQRMLDANDIAEPLTWRPPPPEHPDAPWLGVDPAGVDPHRYAAAFAEHATARNPLSRLRDTTGMSPIHVRLYTDIVQLDMPESQWDNLAVDARGDILDPDRLRHLYDNQQRPLRDIARRSLTTEVVLRRKLTEAGTPLQSSRPRRARITREWFEQHYLNTGKTVRQAASEAGCSPTTLRLYAHEHGVPFGRTALPTNPFASWSSYHMPPPTVVAACAGRRGVEYLRQVVHMSSHRTQRAAAAALGLHENVLMRHRQHIEHAVGIRIFQPATQLVPTPDGEQFLHHAAKALRRLDKTNAGNDRGHHQE